MTPTRIKLKEPHYGKVREICERLGYQSEIKNDRHFDVLSSKTITHRLGFIKPSLGQTRFPLQYDADEVQSCATSFVETYPNLFAARSSMATVPAPVLPQDRVFIINEVAKLMCVQEHTWLKNTGYANSKKAKDNNQEEENSELGDADVELDEDETGASSGAGGAIRSQIDTVELSSDDSDDSDDSEDAEDRYLSDQERLRITKNINIHLDYVYPLDDSQDGLQSSWLFSSGRWPSNVEPWAFRYLHDRNLYNGRTENVEALHIFSNDLMEHLCLNCTEAEKKVVYERCVGLVKRIARQWQQTYNFLAKNRNVLKKTPVFQKQWIAHRARWINVKHNGRSEHLIEIYHRSSPNKISGTKRPADFMNLERCHNMNKQMPNKRISLGTQNIDQGAIPEIQGTSLVDNIGSSYVSSHARGVPMSPPRQLSSPGFQPNTVQNEQEKDVRSNVSNSQIQLPYSNAGPSNTQFDRQVSNVGSKLATLELSIEGKNGIPETDADKIVSGNAFRNASLDDFFQLVSERSGKPLTTLTSLTFRYDWGQHQAEVFTKVYGEEAFKGFKKRIIDYFRLSKAERQNRKSFRVWVRCGDTTDLCGSEDEDDDYE